MTRKTHAEPEAIAKMSEGRFRSFDNLEEIKTIALKMCKAMSERIVTVEYQGGDMRSSQYLNNTLVASIKGKAVVYSIWVGKPGANENKWSLRYIGQASKSTSRERLCSHLFRKHKKTGSKLAEVEKELRAGNQIGYSYIEVHPKWMRSALEEYMIQLVTEKFPGAVLWNVHSRHKANP